MRRLATATPVGLIETSGGQEDVQSFAWKPPRSSPPRCATPARSWRASCWPATRPRRCPVVRRRWAPGRCWTGAGGHYRPD